MAPQPGVESADAPAAIGGVNDLTLPERFVEQLVSGLGKIAKCCSARTKVVGAGRNLAVNDLGSCTSRPDKTEVD
jgi:hypothetical protein